MEGLKTIPLRIAGVGYSVPDTVITNDDLTKLYETSDEWIYTRTGIKERRLVSGNENATTLGVKAASNAIAKSGFKADDIDMIITASSAPPQLYPAISCRIQAALEIPNDAPAFDITAACSGLIYALSIARGFIASGMYKTILIVATDNNSRLLNWEDRSASILFGDGAGAMVVTASEDGIDDIISIDIRANGSIGDLIQLPLAGKNCPLVEPNDEVQQFISMNGKEVYKFVAKVLPQYVEELLAKAGMNAEDIDYLIPHQANLRIIQAVQERLGYSDEKVVTNIKYYGNTSAASIPLAMAEGVEKGNVKLNSKAIICGFGAGMTWGGAIVRLREGIC
jgi:3-oxoacyl-[acyl-carrier-protein] synthase-3